jgi:hypothetical protein
MPKTAKKKAAKEAAAKTTKKAPRKSPAAKKKPATRKPAATRGRTSATVAGASTRRTRSAVEVTGLTGSVTSEDIALKAYYLAERRRHLGLPGTPESDWLEAERLLRP